MRLLLRLVTALLLGSFIGFSTTCGSLDFGSRYHPLTADASSTGPKTSGSSLTVVLAPG